MIWMQRGAKTNPESEKKEMMERKKSLKTIKE